MGAELHSLSYKVFLEYSFSHPLFSAQNLALKSTGTLVCPIRVRLCSHETAFWHTALNVLFNLLYTLHFTYS